MKVTIELEVKPFQIPNYVLVSSDESQSLPLSDLDVDTLGKMCDEFRASVFKKAGKGFAASVKL